MAQSTLSGIIMQRMEAYKQLVQQPRRTHAMRTTIQEHKLFFRTILSWNYHKLNF